MSEIPLYAHPPRHGRHTCTPTEALSEHDLQGYLAHKKCRPPKDHHGALDISIPQSLRG